MKRKHILALFLFGGLWGLGEATLGDTLYSAGVSFASVPLTVIGFFILAVARSFVPYRGAATAIAGLAMLYKVFNVPFFPCHLAGIFLQGLSFDLVFGWRSQGRPSESSLVWGDRLALGRAGLKAAWACYLSRALFCFLMTVIFHYEYWLNQGLRGVWEYVGEGGTVAGAASALLVPLGLILGGRLDAWFSGSASWRTEPRWAGTLATIVTAGVWGWGVAMTLWSNG